MIQWLVKIEDDSIEVVSGPIRSNEELHATLVDELKQHPFEDFANYEVMVITSSGLQVEFFEEQYFSDAQDEAWGVADFSAPVEDVVDAEVVEGEKEDE